MGKTWEPSDILRMKGSGPLQVKRFRAMGIGNKDKGTEQGVIYWQVITSPRYAQKIGVHTILIPETRLKPIKRD